MARLQDLTVIRGVRGSPLDSSLQDFFTTHCTERPASPNDLQWRHTEDGELSSLSLPRKVLRNAIMKDRQFRLTLRELPLEMQDFYVKRGWLFWGGGTQFGECLSARMYISDVKAFGQTKSNVLGKSLGHTIRGLQDLFEDMAFWAKATVLVGTLGLCMYSAIRLTLYARAVINEYAESLADAATSEQGLQRAIDARSGFKKQPASGAIEKPEHPE